MSSSDSSPQKLGLLLSAMAIGVEGALIIWMVPGFLALFAGQAPLDDEQLGYLAAWDINTMAATIGISTFLLRRVDWRLLAGVGLGLLCAGNLAPAAAHSYSAILVSRVFAGSGEGIAIGVSFAALGRTGNPDRSFAIYLVAGAILTAGLLLILPWLQQHLGAGPIFVANAVLAGLVALSLRWFSDGRVPAGGGHGNITGISWRPAVGGLAGVFFYFLAQGEIWSYVERIGAAHGVDAERIGFALAAANISGVGGAALAGMLPRRLGRAGPLIVSACVSIGSFQMLLGSVSATTLIAASVAFTFSWNFAQPLLSGLCSEADTQGRIVCAMGCIQTVGFGLGPALAASLLHQQDFGPVVWSACAAIVAGIVIVLAGVAPARMPSAAVQEPGA